MDRFENEMKCSLREYFGTCQGHRKDDDDDDDDDGRREGCRDQRGMREGACSQRTLMPLPHPGFGSPSGALPPPPEPAGLRVGLISRIRRTWLQSSPAGWD